MRIRPALAASTLVVALTLGAPARSPGTTVVLVSEEQLIDRADLVVHGTVLSSDTAYRQSGVRVFTDVAVEVHEVLKGIYPDPVLHVAMPGGELDGRAIHVVGVPRFVPGEEVCVFLIQLPDGSWTTVGISQGKYRLTPSPATGLKVATQARGTHRLPARVPGRTHAQALRAAAPGRTDWDAFRRRIRERARGGR